MTTFEERLEASAVAAGRLGWAIPDVALRGAVLPMLAAVMKRGESTELRARLAVTLALDPLMLCPYLPTPELHRAWVAATYDAPQKIHWEEWGEALSWLVGSGRVVRQHGRVLRATDALHAVETAGWPDGRAGFVCACLDRATPRDRGGCDE